MTRTIRLLIIATMIATSISTAAAQGVRMRGTIEKIAGNEISMQSTDGDQIKLTLTENAVIVAVLRASMADIKEGTFLGSAAMPQPDGSQKALEVHIFPEQMRGTGEGHRPYAPVPNSTMTNGAASVVATVAGVDGSTLVVKYKGGEKKIVVPPGAPIVRYEIGNRSDLKPGARLTVLAANQKPDGTLEADRINVGRDGVVPQ
jgi:hypothetical protein